MTESLLVWHWHITFRIGMVAAIHAILFPVPL